MGTVAEHQSMCGYAQALHSMDTSGATDALAQAEVVAIQADIEAQTCKFLESGHCAVADLMVKSVLGSPESFRRVIR